MQNITSVYRCYTMFVYILNFSVYFYQQIIRIGTQGTGSQLQPVGQNTTKIVLEY